MKARFLFLLLSGFICCSGAVAAPVEWTRASIDDDVSWSGEIVLSNSVVVSPKGTLRIHPGTKIRVPAGKGISLAVSGRLSIEGKGGDEAVLFLPEKPGGARDQWEGIRLAAVGKEPAVLAGFRIEGAREGVSVTEGEARIRDAVFLGCETGVRGNQKSRVAVDNGLFDGNGNGAVISLGGDGVFRRSRFTNIQENGIVADKGASFRVTASSFERGRTGIFSLTNAPCRVERSVFASLDVGVVARQMGKDSAVSRCEFRNNGTGLLAVQFSSVEVSDSTFRENLTGVDAKEFSSPAVRHNRFEANQAAVNLFRKSHAVVEKNVFFHNRDAVVVNYSSYPRIAGNTFDRNDMSVRLEKFQSGDWEERSGSKEISGGEAAKRGSQFAAIAGMQAKFPKRVFARGNHWGPDPERNPEKGTLGKIRDGRKYGPVRYEGFGDGEYSIDVVDFSEELPSPAPDAGPRGGGSADSPEAK
ncbi:MAG: right-handed parallel beta-helix repeat-containing protein [Deltaproteobacteria bacterium]|nr:MAG: right-handed parallel beta-helix repeat-containing protein [Deltaproteobacteria bacterium]